MTLLRGKTERAIAISGPAGPLYPLLMQIDPNSRLMPHKTSLFQHAIIVAEEFNPSACWLHRQLDLTTTAEGKPVTKVMMLSANFPAVMAAIASAFCRHSGILLWCKVPLMIASDLTPFLQRGHKVFLVLKDESEGFDHPNLIRPTPAHPDPLLALITNEGVLAAIQL